VSAKVIVGRTIPLGDEVAGRVVLAALVEVPKLLPNIVIFFLIQASPILDHKRSRTKRESVFANG
jgi:hypothetical protein